jgi:hypothetical protein
MRRVVYKASWYGGAQGIGVLTATRLPDRWLSDPTYQASPHPPPTVQPEPEYPTIAYWEEPILMLKTVSPVSLQFVDAYLDIG